MPFNPSTKTNTFNITMHPSDTHTPLRNTFSMTGYGSSQCNISSHSHEIAVHIELRSVNSRFLDLHIKLPDELRSLEAMFRKTLSQTLLRGKVECKLVVQHNGNESNLESSVLPCELTIKQLASFEEAVLMQMPNASRLSVMQILNWPGVLQNKTTRTNLIEHLVDNTDHIETIMQCLNTACQQLQNSKCMEGNAIASVLHHKIEHIQTLVKSFFEALPEIQLAHAEKLNNRLNETILPKLQELAQSVPLDPTVFLANDPKLEQRLHEELAILCMQSDVTEELDRIQAHCQSMLKYLLDGEHQSIGKSLDFLCQELNREANTIGSKANGLMQTELALSLKKAIEQIREQVQNIE